MKASSITGFEHYKKGVRTSCTFEWMGIKAWKTITCTGLDTYLHPTCMISKKSRNKTHAWTIFELRLNVTIGQFEWFFSTKEHLTDKSEIFVLVVFVRCKKFFVFEVLMPGLLLLCMVVGPCLGAMIWSLSLSSSLKKSSAEMNARHYRLCHQKLEILQKEKILFGWSNYEPFLELVIQ